MKILNPKLILDYTATEDKTFKQLLKLLGNPNPNWLHYHSKMLKNKGLLDIIQVGNKVIIRNKAQITDEMDKKLVQELRERFPQTKMTMRFIRYG